MRRWGVCQVARARRVARFDCGALSLHRCKMSFKLGPDGEPESVVEYPLHESNSLVEEYMLLANYLVAQQLITVTGDRAALRRHPPLESAKRGAFLAACAALRVAPDTATAGGLQRTMAAVAAAAAPDVAAAVEVCVRAWQ